MAAAVVGSVTAAGFAAARRADRQSGPADRTYAALADRSTRTLEQTFYTGHGLWRMCDPAICNVKNRDWGADALTNLLYFRWQAAHDRSVLPILRSLAVTARMWSPGEPASSDSVMWDAVAEARMYQATRSRVALAKAKAAIAWLGTIKGLGSGACPAVDYQWPFGHRGPLKTIETASNYIKAALLLYQVTGKRPYLTSALAHYAQVRRYYLEPSGLYTAYLFDDGAHCHALPGQYFASVNGNMIWAGQRLAAATGNPVYLREAVRSARAVQTRLSDGAGVFADLQADNDIVGPLVEAMYALAHSAHRGFAARWLLANASAAGSDVNSLGEYGRFFDGPPPAVLTTAWQTDGGIALMQAAAALDPSGRPANTQFWGRATFVPGNRSLGKASPFQHDSLAVSNSSVRISFAGRAIAIMGDVGAMCCSAGHARVLVDGVPTANQVGIWQNMSSPARQQPEQVLFAWRWPRRGHHMITILPAQYDPEEGGSFFAMTGYYLVH
jgi:uncharacterized Zn-binding protein involved in type VI secretion